MALKNTQDHWAFLEEIEGPMWVDLAIEAKCNSKNIDDEWFHSSHPFHHCSARKLKAAFGHSGEGRMSPDFDIKGPFSPKLPSSVSRSRGKDFENKKCRVKNGNLSLNKQHPIKVLKEKSSWVKSGLGEEIKPKLSFINSKGMSKQKKSLVSERGLARKENDLKYKGKYSWVTSGSEEDVKPKQSFINSKRISRPDISLLSDRGSLSSSSSMVDKPGESNTSTITSESNQQCKSTFIHGGSQSSLSFMVDKTDETNTSTISFEGNQQPQRKNLEISSQAFGYTSGFLSTVRISLRKSCISRQASRMEIKCDKGESRDRKSSCSKSSVGSSSNPSYDVKSSKSPLTHNKEKTPDSGYIMKLTETAKKKSSKVSNAQVKVVVCKAGNTRKVAKSAHQETTKSKDQNQTIRPKALQEHRVNQQGLLTGAAKDEKSKSGVLNRLVDAGKENATERVPTGAKGRSGSIASRAMARDQKVTKKNVPQKGDQTAVVGPKGKISRISNEKLPTNVTRRLHLR